MKLTFITECRFYRNQNNEYYSNDMSFGNVLWERYLEDFEKVFVIARVFETTEVMNKSLLVSNVEFCPILPYENVQNFFFNFLKIKSQIENYLNPDNVTIIRGPGSLGLLASQVCLSRGLKYGLEVVGDPYDVFAPGVIKHPLRPILRSIFVKGLKWQVLNTLAAIYVTQRTLQRRYPTSSSAFTTSASDVKISDDKFVNNIKDWPSDGHIELVSVGSLDQLYKSPDILLQALSILKKRNILFHFTWVGDGRNMDSLKLLAKKLNVDGVVSFVGSVSADEVLGYLDRADIFILVSRTEGLPRAVIEAMARGLPCIGTNVGGIPELLDSEVLVAKENPQAIVDKILYMIDNPKFTKEQAVRNLKESRSYSDEVLSYRRKYFYKYLKENYKIGYNDIIK